MSTKTSPKKKTVGGDYFCFVCLHCRKQFHLYLPAHGIIVFPAELTLNEAHRLVHTDDNAEVTLFA